MAVTEQEKQQILREAEEKRKRELSERMAAIGRIKSHKKTKAARRTIKLAQQKRKELFEHRNPRKP
jgi:hypothetical protein